MATRMALSLCRLTIVGLLGLVFLILGHGRAYASPIKIASPVPDSTVANLVTTSVRIKHTVKKVAFLIDGNLMASTSSTSFTWNSTMVVNGMHTITASAYSASNQLLHTVSERVRVSNKRPPSPTPTSTPTATRTPTPTPTATPTATPGPVVSFVSPTNGQSVGGTTTVTLAFSKPASSTDPTSVWWTHLSVDGAPAGDGYNNLPWNMTTVTNGSHVVRVDGYAYNSTTSLGNATINVTVSNSISSPTATATPTSAPTPTPTPTIAPTPTPTGGATKTPTPTSTPTPGPGSTFYVSPSGSDSASGSSSAPWRTIQKAADTLNAGQTAIIAGGNYGERVSISRSGTQTSLITLKVASGADAQLLGFDVTGSDWVLDGFDISTQTNGSSGYGIHVDGSASYVTIQNSYVHELCHEGVFMEPGVSHIQVLNNRFWRAEMSGVQADGMYDLIQGNEVWETQQYAMNAGGIYAGCTIAGGADADAFRFFGQHNVFRSNYAHDIYHDMPGDPHPTNPNPHTDCFQTWGSTAMTVSDILFERNLCRWPGTNQFALANINATTLANIGANDGAVTNLTFQNNILSNAGQGLAIESGIGPMNVLNNTFDHVAQEGLVCNGPRTSADQIINNIFYDVGAGGDSYASGCQSSTYGNNDFYMPGGATVGTYPNVVPYMSIAPGFVAYGDSTGGGADFHLGSGSGLIGAGITLPQVTDDYYGNSRPATGYSVGAAQ
jgi:hypothetical protein